MQFELKHTFDAPPKAVIDAMTDPAFPAFMKQHMKMMSDIQSVDRKEAGERLEWRLRCVPVPLIKRVGPKEVPPEALAFIQESQIDRSQLRGSFRNVAEHPKVKRHLESSGSYSFRDLGGRTERVLSGELKVTNLPFLLKFLAGIAEQLIFSNAKDLLNEEAKVFGEFLKSRTA
jgi:hypothetical protein